MLKITTSGMLAIVAIVFLIASLVFVIIGQLEDSLYIQSLAITLAIVATIYVVQAVTIITLTKEIREVRHLDENLP